MSNHAPGENWVSVGKLEDIPPLGARIVRREGGNIAIFRAEGDRIYALENRCPHKGGPLAEGIVHGCRVTCPLHNWVIDLDSGEAVGPDEGVVKRYDVKLIDGEIYLHDAALKAQEAA